MPVRNLEDIKLHSMYILLNYNGAHCTLHIVLKSQVMILLCTLTISLLEPQSSWTALDWKIVAIHAEYAAELDEVVSCLVVFISSENNIGGICQISFL